jgi:hypothetical protein
LSQNPYQSPESVSPVPGSNHFQIAKAQKNVLYVLLAQILFNVVAIPAVVSSPDNVALGVIIQIVGFGLSIAALVVLYLLASKVYNLALGILCAILGLVPCLNLLTLLIVNSKATRTLQAAGFKVGLMGADLSQFK